MTILTSTSGDARIDVILNPARTLGDAYNALGYGWDKHSKDRRVLFTAGPATTLEDLLRICALRVERKAETNDGREDTHILSEHLVILGAGRLGHRDPVAHCTAAVDSVGLRRVPTWMEGSLAARAGGRTPSGVLRLARRLRRAAAAQPYLDYVEFMTYFTNLTAPLTPRRSVEDNLNALPAPPFNYRKDQIIVGVGFSSGSTANVSTAEVGGCAYWGWGCTGPYTSNGPHSSVGMNSMTWDRIAADVDAGKGYRGMSGAKQGYAHWYFFPDPATGNATGELTWWNSLSDFEYYTSFVNERQLGGVFSWVATSDAPDWRVHKQLHRDLLTSLQN